MVDILLGASEASGVTYLGRVGGGSVATGQFTYSWATLIGSAATF
jgi:hypothetical protein